MENPIKMDDLGVPLFKETSNMSVGGDHSKADPRHVSGNGIHSP